MRCLTRATVFLRQIGFCCFCFRADMFQCLGHGMCKKVYKHRQSLLRHVREIHGAQDEFRCELCGKEFARREYWQKHIQLVHKKIRPFVCPQCKARFGVKSNLKTHLKCHSKRYECLNCKKSYSSDQRLRRHVANVHKKIVVKCRTCEKKFSSEDTLGVYVRKQRCLYTLRCFYSFDVYSHESRVHECELACSEALNRFQFCTFCGKKYVIRKERLDCQESCRSNSSLCELHCLYCGRKCDDENVADSCWLTCLRRSND